VGRRHNLFHQGAAKESDDPDVIAATMAMPGVVLKRPVGSDGAFSEHAELPKDIGRGERKKKPPKPSGRKAKKSSPELTRRQIGRPLKHTNGERQRRELEEAKEEAARQKERKRRLQAVNKAQATIDRAQRRHAKRSTALRTEIETIEKKLKAEDADWQEEEGRLEAALLRARS
jgi:hypothetical protein